MATWTSSGDQVRPVSIITCAGIGGATLALVIGVVDTRQAYIKGCPHKLPEKYILDAVIAYYPGTDWVTLAAPNARTLVTYLGGTR
jgi:hypothetical protein